MIILEWYQSYDSFSHSALQECKQMRSQLVPAKHCLRGKEDGGIVRRNYWHERALFQRSAFGRWTAGNDVVVTKNDILFFSFLFSVVYFSHRRSAWI